MGFDSLIKPSKKRLCVEDDRISHLPKDVICKILNFVTPTKYAIRTSVLSKRWEYLWALSPNIFFDSKQYRSSEEQPAITFKNSVDNLLFLRDCLRIDTFELNFYGEFSSFCVHASSWICAVVFCNIRELDIHIDLADNDLGELPWCLFTCKTLVILKLSGKFILNVPHQVCLPNLNTLLLSWIIYVDDAGIQKLLSGCPVLEDLQIRRHLWDQTWILNIDFPSLKKLSLISNDEIYDYQERICWHKFFVDAPNLEFIELKDDWPNEIYLNALPNIVEAHIDIGTVGGVIYREEAEKFLSLFQSIIKVRHLFLYYSTFLILDEDFEFALPRFSDLVYMEIDYSNGPFRLMEFLRSAPNLEVISFPCGLNYERHVYPDVDDDDDGFVDLEFRLNDPERVPECLDNSLQIVEIKQFKGQAVELNIVTYLLENAMILDKMTIYFCRDIEIIEFQRYLTSYPRLSVGCQLEFIRDD